MTKEWTVKDKPIAENLVDKILEVRQFLMDSFGISKEELFWSIVNGGEYYVKRRVKERDYKSLISNKGFWHWYEQVYCMNVVWLLRDMEVNAGTFGKKNLLIFGDNRITLGNSNGFSYFERILWTRIDGYDFAPVLISMHNDREYMGRVFW